jgi:RNA polymerase sigma-70 factor (ECF subfamily)
VANDDVQAGLVAHRPALLRHCYRLLGSFAEAEDLVQDTLERAWKARASYAGQASVQRWLFAIATNGCLNALARRRRRRALPQLDRAPARGEEALGELETSHWITPAADASLFPDPAEAAESRETVALAFVALLQRLPPRQRAALLMKDVLGWPAEEIAGALGLTLSSVNSAIHRGRQATAGAAVATDEPPPAILRDFVRAWQARDLDALVALLRQDVVLAMPPHAAWFRGADAAAQFFRTQRFSAYWRGVVDVTPTRANGLPALAFLRVIEGAIRPHALMVARFVDQRVAEMTVFVGEGYFAGFDRNPPADRTISGGSMVMSEKGEPS